MIFNGSTTTVQGKDSTSGFTSDSCSSPCVSELQPRPHGSRSSECVFCWMLAQTSEPSPNHHRSDNPTPAITEEASPTTSTLAAVFEDSSRLVKLPGFSTDIPVSLRRLSEASSLFSYNTMSIVRRPVCGNVTPARIFTCVFSGGSLVPWRAERAGSVSC